MKSAYLASASLAFLLAVATHPAHGVGAMAVAEPASVADDGYAVGISYNQSSPANAERIALEQCNSVDEAPPATRKLCKVVRTFQNQCGAAAIDPKNGTPGAGWAIADTLELAKRDALQRCEDTAGTNRRGECRVTLEGCDGSAK